MTRADRIRWNRYDRYLKSPDWQLTRAAWRGWLPLPPLGPAGAAADPLHAGRLSHENYHATGRTPVSDRQTLCRQCHEVTRGRQFRQRTFSPWLGRWWRRLTLRQRRCCSCGLAGAGPDPAMH
jgi:hypothetical protein